MSYNSEDYFNSKKFKSLLQKFEEAEQAGRVIILDSDELVDIAEYYYNNGNTEYAKEIIDRTESLYPGAAAPLLFKARMALLDYNDTKQAEYYTDLIEDKTDLEYYYIKAEIMIADGKTDEADLYLEDCYSDIDEEDRSYFAIDTAAIFNDYDSVDKAEKWIKRSDKTDSVEYKEQFARVMMGKGEYEKSSQLFNELIDKDPYSTQYWNSLASSQLFCNNIEESISSSEYSIAINPNNTTALLNKANGLYNLGNYKEAQTYYHRYNELCPDDGNGEMLIGFCDMLLDNFESAIGHFQKAEELSEEKSPCMMEIYKDWAFALCRLNRIDESMELLDKADKLECDHNDLLVYRGSLLIGSERFNESKEYFLKAIKDSGYSPDIFTKISAIVFESGNISVAYKMFQMLFTKYKNWHEGYAYFAACCYELNKKDDFLDSLQKAVMYTPDETKALLGKLFPDEMPPKDYYQYMYNKIMRK